MATVTTVLGWTTFLTEMGVWFTLKGTFMKACGSRGRRVDTECWRKGVGITLRDIGLRTRGKDRAVTSIPRKIRSLLESGSMICLEQGFIKRSSSRSKNHRGRKIMMMNMFYQLFRLLGWRMPLMCWRELWKKLGEIGLIIGRNIYLWMNFSKNKD